MQTQPDTEHDSTADEQTSNVVSLFGPHVLRMLTRRQLIGERAAMQRRGGDDDSAA
jgi:hypothetical protein